MLSVEQVQEFIAAATGAGWSVTTKPEPSLFLAADIVSRYPVFPAEYGLFLSHVASCVNAGENVWFLTEADYNAQDLPENTFHWNAWELLTLDALQDDAEACAATTKFWAEHLPIMSAVHSDYAYIAIRVLDGAIVCGYAPAFDEPSDVCASFEEFLTTLGGMLAGRIPTEVNGNVRFEFVDFM